MKKHYKFYSKIAAFLTLFVLLSSVLYAQPTPDCIYTWTTQTSGTTHLLNSVKAVNDMICWTAGNSGTIRRTTDGGATWLNANPNPGVITGNILNIEAIDADNAWCSSSPAINTFIYKTTNGGNNWVQVYSRIGGYINGIHMISPSNGYVFGDPVANVWNILVTTNGGSNWLPLPTTPAAQVAESGFNNCFQVSLPYMWFGASLGSVYRTTNNGVNWTSHETPGIFIYVQALHFNSQSLGLASGTTMVKSTDAGATYFAHPVLGAGNINGIEGSGNDFWYLRGEYIYRSSDGGNNWSLVHTSVYTQIAIDFPDNTAGCLTGWAVGYGGSITKMTGLPAGTGNNNSGLPVSYKLEQNYPNPFNPATKIKFALLVSGFVSLKIYDILGNEVYVLEASLRQAGYYEAEFDASNLASGVYFYKLEAKGFTATKKMLLIK